MRHGSWMPDDGGLAPRESNAFLHHSDQGSQYTSEQFQRLLADNGITCSMSKAGNVWDRAMGTPLVRGTMARSAIESFFSTLKIEWTACKMYRTRNEARADVFDYIERFYNPQPFETGLPQPDGV